MKIGRYEVVRELGQGGMAMVYLARDPFIKRQVAVKVLPRQFTFDPEFRARFQREAEIIATLEHLAIVPVYDFGEDQDQPFIVMRHMTGGSLADLLTKGPLPVAEIAALFERLGSALDHAHRLGVIHRDIKPGNILFDAQHFSYLSDFGISKIAEATASLTGTGLIGTPAYMSPEQAQGDDLDGRCDIYSLGVVLFQALTGELPYNADTPMGQAMAHIIQPVPSLLERKPDLPPAFEPIIHKSLDKSPDNRYQTASQLAQAIHDGAQKPVVPPAIRMTPAPPSPPTRLASQQQESERHAAGTTRPELIPVEHEGTSVAPPASVKNKATLPSLRLWGVGGVSVLLLCLCAGLIGGLAFGLLPNPFMGLMPVTGGEALPTSTQPSESSTGLSTSLIPTLNDVTQPSLAVDVSAEASATALTIPSLTPGPTATQAVSSQLISFTAATNMLCREGPGTDYPTPWQLNAGEIVPVLAQWYLDADWLLVDINVPATLTRTDCCWVGGDGTLNVALDQIRTIDFLPDRLDCSAVQ